MNSTTVQTTDVRSTYTNRLPLFDTVTETSELAIAGRTSEIRSEWTDIDYAVRRVEDPVEMLAQMLDRLPS